MSANVFICRCSASASGLPNTDVRGLQALPRRERPGLKRGPDVFELARRVMGWLSTFRNTEPQKIPVATAEELTATFVTEHDHLYWISLVITGDPALATNCLVDASRLSRTRTGVFRDWLVSWSRYATARIAVSSMRDAIAASAPRYASLSCTHSNHELLSIEQIDFVRRLDPTLLFTELDPVARAVLVLRGCQGVSIGDCALLLQLSRKCVIGAYCNALRWISQRNRAPETVKTSLIH